MFENVIIVGVVEIQVYKGVIIVIGIDYLEWGKVVVEMMLIILDGVDFVMMLVSEVFIVDVKIVINLSVLWLVWRKEGGLKGKVVLYGDLWDSKLVVEW